MDSKKRIVAILGTYRKGGIIDSAVDEIIDSAKEEGAEVSKIYLIDRHIEFCTNCRTCNQKEGVTRGECPQKDEMSAILDEIAQADAIVVASPMNFWSVTAVMKRFIERLVCFAYWPWGMPAPKTRDTRRDKRAVVVASCAAPAILARLRTRMTGLLKTAADLLGAKTVGVLFMGFSAMKQHQKLSERTKKKARALGKKLVANR